MQKDVVLVTFNYRLGSIGFLSLKDPNLGVPGNAGLKDQTMALKWVQKNIEKFGGDAENVTIFGESVSVVLGEAVIDANHFQAGGSSAHLHMLSNHSKNLFKRAIAMSGCAYSPWAMAPPSNWAERLGKHLGWAGDSEPDLLEFLEACTPSD
jgi:carboxylesterase type B